MNYQKTTPCKDELYDKMAFWGNCSVPLDWPKEEIVKGTVSIISSDSYCRDVNAGFRTVPLKALSDQVWIRYQCL